MQEITINGEVYVRKSEVAKTRPTIDMAIYYLDKLKGENWEQEIIVELPGDKRCTFKLRDCLIYEGAGGYLVFDGE